jgi:ribosomal protein S18 acetylase RimI-like enzyme
MTRNQNIITEEEQKIWYLGIDKNKLIPYLFYQNDEVIGYGIVTVEEDHCLITGGIVEKKRNLGIGKYLFEELEKESAIRRAKIKLEVLKTNSRAFKLYQNIGFELYDESDTLYYMKKDLINE